MERNETQQALRDFVVREMLNGQERELTESTPLLEWGIIDSLNLVALVAFIEDRFAVKVPDDAVSPENFGSLGLITDLVARLASPQG